MRPIRYMFSALAVLGLLGACTPVNLLNTITPSGAFTRMKDISYGDHARQVLDIYKPDTAKPNAPVLVYVHGGSWSEGSKDIYKFVADSFTSEGYTVVIPNYRLYPEVRFPAFINDTAKAVKWTQDRYPDTPLILIGHSAGGYNVLMSTLDPSYLAAQGGEVCSSVAGVVSIAGPTGIVPLKEEPYITIFPEAMIGNDAPMNHTEAQVPPVLFLHGQKDKTVYPQNATTLADKLTARGADAKALVYPKLNHTGVVRVLSRYFDGDSTLEADLLSFIRANSEKKANYCQ